MNSQYQDSSPVWNALWAASIANFLVFFLVAVIIGGSAIYGEIADGGYYVGDHGVLTEVGLPVYVYSVIHSLATLILFPVGVVAALVSYSYKGLPPKSSFWRWLKGGPFFESRSSRWKLRK